MKMLLQKICGLAKRVARIERKQLRLTKQPVYEYRDIWAEESGRTNANSAEWSYGNGATGFIGLPVDSGWELTALALHADTFASQAVLSVDAMAYPASSPGSSAANSLATITINGATDGGGEVNNAFKFLELTSPVAVPVTRFGFITRTRTGNSSDVRVYARLRRKAGDYVSDVTWS
jgi:hypothetical protein